MEHPGKMELGEMGYICQFLKGHWFIQVRLDMVKDFVDAGDIYRIHGRGLTHTVSR